MSRLWFRAATDEGNASLDSDIDLVRAAQQGDRVAFAGLVRRYQNAVSGVAFALTGRFGLSEDVAQETFIATWRRMSDLREPERFRSFVLGVARRKSLRALRDNRAAFQKTDLAGLSDDVASSDPSPLEHAISREEEEFVWLALKKIPESYRVPLVLFYREQQSLEKVAEILGISPTNLRTRLMRGRRMLVQQVTHLLEAIMSRTRVGELFTAAVIALVALEAAPAAAASSRVSEGAARPGGSAGRRAWLAAATAAGLLVVAAGSRLVGGGGPDAISSPAAGSLSRSQSSVLQITPASSAAGQAGRESASRTVAEREAASVLDFDFEDGILPEEFDLGHVVPGPPRQGSKHALLATLYVGVDGSLSMGIRLAAKNLTYRDTLVLSFDYWHGDRAGEIAVEMWNSDRSSNYGRVLTPNGPRNQSIYEDIRPGSWTHVTLSLWQLLPAKKEAGALQAGDRFRSLSIWAGNVGGKGFLVDNLRIADSESRPGPN